ncbi:MULTISPECIES: methylmalonyl-CoA mutase family protein [unclassified Lentimicrobium]|uniref:methylmalonyl-CoA mutase family protein n=1 Tax=unclassified Lentimicrobium TaxID=2677434 RepID=UPI00155760C7|nr:MULTISPECIES: methylmalonyl-CoA mutase family protein [unclassified Lentimicrobium]NPD47229.1 methylmalonyl-CoA mutase small subunit [Lentimicrobium sp. S6]NPD83746.1 methylmalonyl-CoA mutase small subunit [Lentimicrobium sp. L6]
MSQDKTNQNLFEDFAPVSTEQWEEKIKTDLKGADYLRRLFWNSPEGIQVKPFYRSEDLENITYLDNKPDQFPYVRGTKKHNNDWLVRQDIFVDDVEKANKKALDILMKGVNSLCFIFSDKYIAKVSDIEKLMENIQADSVEVNFKIGTGAHKVIAVYEELVKKYNRAPEDIEGSVDFDPFFNLTFKGHYCQSEEYAFKHAAQLIQAAEFLPKFKTLSVNGLNLRNAGANVVQELAYSLSMGAEYITRLTDEGLSVDDIAPRIKFHFGVGSNYFMEIAKLRAARALWANIVNAYGPENAEKTKMHIHSSNISLNKTVYDAHVNMLRTTTESFSALLGGTDSFTVLPYNANFEWPTEFSERIARNQQLLLKEESFIDKVADPAAGSYYIESLTNELIEKTWELFLKVDELGGYTEAIKQGFIQDDIEKSAEERKDFAAKRKEIYLGTNQYPNFTEHFDHVINPDSLKPFDLTSKNATVKTLKQFRVTQDFEMLRFTTDMYSKENKRPLAFMLTTGNLNMRKARAQFACNFFAVAGFEVQDNNGFATIEEGLKAAKAANAEIVVLCSSDDDYAEVGMEFAKATKDTTIGVIAGYPKNLIEEFKANGLSKLIHVKSNILEELTAYQKELGIIE